MADVIISSAGTDDYRPWEDVINHPIVHVYRSPVIPQTFFRIDEELAEKLGLKDTQSREFVFVKFPLLENFPIKGLDGETRRFKVTYGPEWLYDNAQMNQEEVTVFFDLENPDSNHKIYAYSKEDYVNKRDQNSVLTVMEKFLYAPFNLNVLLCDNGDKSYVFFYLDFIRRDFVFNGGPIFPVDGSTVPDGDPAVTPETAKEINQFLLKEYIQSSGGVHRMVDTTCGKPIPPPPPPPTT